MAQAGIFQCLFILDKQHNKAVLELLFFAEAHLMVVVNFQMRNIRHARSVAE